MEWKDFLYELVEMVKNTAPALWQIAYRQVMIEAFQMGVWSFFVLTVSIGLNCGRTALWAKAKSGDLDRYDRESHMGAGWAAAFMSAFFLVLFTGLLVGIVSRLINPDYYAIAILIGMVK